MPQATLCQISLQIQNLLMNISSLDLGDLLKSFLLEMILILKNFLILSFQS